MLYADLTRPLGFAADGEFDLVICPMVLHYLKDWKPALSEFHRVLKSQGAPVFSTHASQRTPGFSQRLPERKIKGPELRLIDL